MSSSDGHPAEPRRTTAYRPTESELVTVETDDPRCDGVVFEVLEVDRLAAVLRPTNRPGNMRVRTDLCTLRRYSGGAR